MDAESPDVFKVLVRGREVTVRRRDGSSLVFDAEFTIPPLKGPEGFTISASGVGVDYDRDSIARIVEDTALELLREYEDDAGV